MAEENALPEFSGNILGDLPGAKQGYPGRPIMEHVGGNGYSTHFNSVQNVNGKEHIIPTMYGGKLYDPEEAKKIAVANSMIDPDTGHPMPGFDTADEALAHENMLHSVLQNQANQAILQKQVLDTIHWPFR